MVDTTVSGTAAERGLMTRAVEVVLGPSPSQERLLRSYAGSMRAGYNWAIALVRDNINVRRAERARGVPEDELTPALSWSGFSIVKRWREVRDEVHPWHREVSVQAFRTGIDNAALACKNLSESKSGKRRGPKVGFRSSSTAAAAASSPGCTPTHQTGAVREVWQWCETGRGRVQALTINPRATLVKLGRYYPSTQTCSQCAARTKLALWQPVYHCTTCGLTLDRDVNAARNIAAEGQRLLREQQHEQQHQHVASIRGETQNREPRSGETEPAQLRRADGHRSSEPATVPASPPRAGSRDLPVPVA